MIVCRTKDEAIKVGFANHISKVHNISFTQWKNTSKDAMGGKIGLISNSADVFLFTRISDKNVTIFDVTSGSLTTTTATLSVTPLDAIATNKPNQFVFRGGLFQHPNVQLISYDNKSIKLGTAIDIPSFFPVKVVPLKDVNDGKIALSYIDSNFFADSNFHFNLGFKFDFWFKLITIAISNTNPY